MSTTIYYIKSGWKYRKSDETRLEETKIPTFHNFRDIAVTINKGFKKMNVFYYPMKSPNCPKLVCDKENAVLIIEKSF